MVWPARPLHKSASIIWICRGVDFMVAEDSRAKEKEYQSLFSCG